MSSTPPPTSPSNPSPSSSTHIPSLHPNPNPLTIRGSFPPPLIYPPLKPPHHQTLIILHGRGSTASKVAPPLLSTPSSLTQQTLQTAFPHAKLVFPTASLNRATIYKRALTHQWFDNWHLDLSLDLDQRHGDHVVDDSDRLEHEEMVIPGLRKSVLFLKELIEREASEVEGGIEKVVVWGLSQWCATALGWLLLSSVGCEGISGGGGGGEGEGKGKGIAGVVGMCGYLPLVRVILESEEGMDGDGDENDSSITFAYSDDGEEEDQDDKNHANSTSEIPTQPIKPTPQLSAITAFRNEFDLYDNPPSTPPNMTFQSIPVFLGHGTKDEKVPINLGRQAKECLTILGVDVQMKEYEGLGHWYSPEMLEDIFVFLRDKLEC